MFKQIGGGCSNSNEMSSAKIIWEDWIFAESQRRYYLIASLYANTTEVRPHRFANLWLLVGVAVCTKNGNICDASQSYKTLPLPGPKSLWEAPTQFAWESEYEACHVFQPNGLGTLGDLIDAQQSASIPANARKLDKWNAGADTLGCLLNLVGSME